MLRAERDKSQADLAAHLAVSRPTVDAIETGKYDPSLPLARAVGEPVTAKMAASWIAPPAMNVATTAAAVIGGAFELASCPKRHAVAPHHVLRQNDLGPFDTQALTDSSLRPGVRAVTTDGVGRWPGQPVAVGPRNLSR